VTSSRAAFRCSLVAAVIATVGARATPAAAQDQAHVPADALFAEGRDLLEKGRFAEACPKLAQSQQLAPAVGTLLNLAYCYEQIGKLRSAIDAYVEAETLATAAGETKRATFARDRITAVEPRAPKLIVRVVLPEAPGLEIRRDGKLVAKAELDRPIAVDPQDHVVTASAPGYASWKGIIIVRGEGATVTMLVPPLDDAGGGASKEEPSGSPFTTRRIAALGLGTASALAIGGGIAAAFSAKSRYDDASSHCDASGCDDAGESIQHGAVVEGNIATALIAFGALCGAGAIYLWIAGAPASPPKSTVVSFDLGPRGTLGGRF
jgi:serine/threonine-protein kinase